MTTVQCLGQLKVCYYDKNVYLSEVSCTFSGDKNVINLCNCFKEYYLRVRILAGRKNKLFLDFENTLRNSIVYLRLNKTMFGMDDFSSLFYERKNIKPKKVCNVEFFSDTKVIIKSSGLLDWNDKFYDIHSLNIFLIFIVLTLSDNDLIKFSSLLREYLLEIPIYK